MHVQLNAILATVAFAAFATRFLRRATLTAGLRAWAEDFSPLTARLFSCPHCLGLWLSLPCAWLLHADALNLAMMVLLGWRGSYFLNRLIDKLIVRRHTGENTRHCHVCQKHYQKDFIQRLDRDFCSHSCWFNYLRDQRRAERPLVNSTGEFIHQEVYPMSYQNLNPSEASVLLAGESSAVYIDVRSVPEYENGHPAGALNIPVMHRENVGMVPNADFVRVVQSHFATDAKLLVGCQSGARSIRAAEALIAAGFTDITNVTGGFGGTRSQTGEVVERGWLELGLPVEHDAEGDNSYTALVVGVDL